MMFFSKFMFKKRKRFHRNGRGWVSWFYCVNKLVIKQNNIKMVNNGLGARKKKKHVANNIEEDEMK